MMSMDTGWPRPILSMVDLEMPVSLMSSFLLSSLSMSSFQSGLYEKATDNTSFVCNSNIKVLSCQPFCIFI